MHKPDAHDDSSETSSTPGTGAAFISTEIEVLVSGLAAAVTGETTLGIAAATAAPLLKEGLLALWALRRKDLGQRALEYSGLSAEELLRATLQDERHLDLFRQILEAAQEASLEDKRRALAKVWARAADGTTEVDAAVLYAQALRDLDPPHVEVMKAVSSPRPGGGELSGQPTVGSVTADELRTLLPGHAKVLEPIIATLTRHALIRNTKAGTYDGLEGNEAWSLSEFGAQVAELLGHDATVIPEQPWEQIREPISNSIEREMKRRRLLLPGRDD